MHAARIFVGQAIGGQLIEPHAFWPGSLAATGKLGHAQHVAAPSAQSVSSKHGTAGVGLPNMLPASELFVRIASFDCDGQPARASPQKRTRNRTSRL